MGGPPPHPPPSGAPGLRHLMDGMGWQDIKSLRQLLVGNEDSALRGALEECAYPCMRRQPIVLAQSSALSAATIDRRRSRWGRYRSARRSACHWSCCHHVGIRQARPATPSTGRRGGYRGGTENIKVPRSWTLGPRPAA